MTRPTTIRPCPNCGEPLDEVETPRNHDRGAVRFFRCIPCGVEEGHEAETIPELEAA